MTTDSVEERGEAQAKDRSNEEEEENEFLSQLYVCVTLVTQRLHVEDDGCRHECHKSNEVGPDVSSLGVNTKD